MPSILTIAGASAAIALTATVALTTPRSPDARTAGAGRGGDAVTTVVRYGGSAAVGNGRARAYVVLDARTMSPMEIGVAFTEPALDGLPDTGAGHHGAHALVHQYNLPLPEQAAPFRFIELDWNPMGHEPEGVYQDVPHFDFHFYTVDQAARDAIVPSDPQYAARANALPQGDLVPPHMALLAPPGAAPADVAVPMMGVHWVDTRSAELQGLFGKPDAYAPFTTTFILGSWDGRFHFWEPMVTRAYILAKRSAADPAVRDEVIPIPVPERYEVPGHYPTAYRIAWDGAAKEYRVALTSLVRRD